MDNLQYIKLGSLHWIVQAIPESVTGDTVTVEIKRLSDGYTWNFSTLAFVSGSQSGNMTFISDILWKQSFTPPTDDTYIVTINDSTLGVKYVQVLKAQGAAAPAGLTGDELTTLAALKSYLNKETADTVDDTYLETLIAQVSAEIQKKCNRTFADATVTEYHKGNGTPELLVRRPPVNSVTSINIDADRVWGSDTAIDADDISISEDLPGKIVIDGDVFDLSNDIENVKIIYNGGYSTIPADLEKYCQILCACEYVESRRLNNKVEGERNFDELRKRTWKAITGSYKLWVI